MQVSRVSFAFGQCGLGCGAVEAVLAWGIADPVLSVCRQEEVWTSPAPRKRLLEVWLGEYLSPSRKSI